MRASETVFTLDEPRERKVGTYANRLQRFFMRFTLLNYYYNIQVRILFLFYIFGVFLLIFVLFFIFHRNQQLIPSKATKNASACQ